MRSIVKKWFCLLLAAVMTLTLLPAAVLPAHAATTLKQFILIFH